MLEMQASSLRILASDSIPEESNICGGVYFKSLLDSKEDWADRALSLAQYDRQSLSVDDLYKEGYDIVGNVKKLESFYLSL